MLIGLAAVVMAITLVVLAAFMIPAFIEIRKTAASLREFIACTDSELKPVLHELHLTITELKIIVEVAATKSEDVKSFMEALGDTSRNLRTINNVVGTVVGVLATSTAWAVGAKAAGRFILESISKKRKGG
ncbi:MAG TPA: DUF948 domain-containing protein [Geobacteraceae bacterium]|nr:DUF948 domain-containing protein [Geobacteraceae bacterium]